jgi:sugar-specific transcriptional regulator TrmB
MDWLEQEKQEKQEKQQKQEKQEKNNKIGLTDKESAVYSTLLELGGAYPSKIAEKTKINRSTVYKILLDLSVKGLVSEIQKKGKLFYQIENPDKLARYLKDKVTIANDQFEKAQKYCLHVSLNFLILITMKELKILSLIYSFKKLCLGKFKYWLHTRHV